MSGMKTGLMMCFALWTLATVAQEHINQFIIMATLLALTRPEGSVMAVIAVVIMGWQKWREERSVGLFHQYAKFLFPILAAMAQPIVNLILTGSLWSTGNQAKSLLGLIPRDWSLIV